MTVVLLESDWLDCEVVWANIAEEAIIVARMSLFIAISEHLEAHT
jgi:hypothetical protein